MEQRRAAHSQMAALCMSSRPLALSGGNVSHRCSHRRHSRGCTRMQRCISSRATETATLRLWKSGHFNYFAYPVLRVLRVLHGTLLLMNPEKMWGQSRRPRERHDRSALAPTTGEGGAERRELGVCRSVVHQRSALSLPRLGLLSGVVPCGWTSAGLATSMCYRSFFPKSFHGTTVCTSMPSNPRRQL